MEGNVLNLIRDKIYTSMEIILMESRMESKSEID